MKGLLLVCTLLLSACTIQLPTEHDIRTKMREATALAKQPIDAVEDIIATIEEPISITVKQPDELVEGLIGNLHLAQALASLPEGANHVHFIDWTLVREYEGFEDIAIDSEELRWEFVQIIGEYHLLLPAFAWGKLLDHKEYWSFDNTDFAWEARISISRIPGHVLKFRDDFDFTQLYNLMEEREYVQTDYHGITIFTTRFTRRTDSDEEWRYYSELSMQNIAVLPDENLLLVSTLEQNVYDMLDAHFERSNSLYDRPSVQPTLQRLGKAFGAFISADACAAFSSDALIKTRALSQNSARMWPLLKVRPELHSYETLGIAYHYEEYDSFSPESLIVMQFASAEEAQDDLAPRSQLAEEGISWAESAMSYQELYFTLDDSYVDGSQIIMEVEPKYNFPKNLFWMTFKLDMIFATCP